MEKIESEINREITSGGKSCYVTFQVIDSVKKELESLGYNVSCGSDRNESYTAIGWAHAE